MKPHALVPLLAGFLCLTAHPAEPDRLAPFYQPGKIRALILSGRNNHGWRTTTPFLDQLLTDSGRFDVRVAEATDGITSDTLAPYDVFIMDYGGPSWGPVTEKAIEDAVSGGRGFVTVHGASYHFSGLDVITDGHRAVGWKEPPWPAFRRMVGCGWDAMPPEGYHGPRHSFPVTITRPEHPIVAGLPPTFMATDELYHGMTVLPEAQVIATARSHKDRGGTGRDEPMLVTTTFGRGRGFYTALGHETAAMWEPGFRATFIRGVEWAATGRVTLAPDVGWPKPDPNAIRVLVVTGGHDHHPAFYTLFEDLPGVSWRHVASAAEAFRSDIRKGTDVVVLYDMTTRMPPEAQRNLRDYLEAGKGLVVLHHALADHQDWDWWAEEVVGARYLLEARGNQPGSTYLHDQWVEATPAMAHPVVGDIGPIRLLDETYKGVWQSPKIKPLYRTANPTSDAVIAWIGPWEKSRVIGIQPGHDEHSHRHPAYRQLVANAIRWTSQPR